MNALTDLPIPLLSWYRDNARDLPWRKTENPYCIWISEIMLQQTRVAAVLEYYRRFLMAFPTVAELAAAPEEQLLKLWQGLGYYSRARNLQKAAVVIVAQHGGEFPSGYEAIRALPGIGDYTAAAVTSIAFGEPRPAVDGNLLRVSARILGEEGEITAPAIKKKLTALLQEIIPLDFPGQFNQAMMDLGATICLPNGAPLCDQCPAEGFCRAHQEGKTAVIPVKKAKKPRRVELRKVFLIFFGNRVALRKRPNTGLLAKLWELPHEALPAEGYPAAWGVEPISHRPGQVGKHIFTHVEWRMTSEIVEAASDALPKGWVWADRRELAEIYAVPSAFSPFFPFLEERLH